MLIKLLFASNIIYKCQSLDIQVDLIETIVQLSIFAIKDRMQKLAGNLQSFAERRQLRI